jgi:hypothetical protein
MRIDNIETEILYCYKVLNQLTVFPTKFIMFVRRLYFKRLSTGSFCKIINHLIRCFANVRDARAAETTHSIC